MEDWRNEGRLILVRGARASKGERWLGRQVDYFRVPWDQFEEQIGEESTIMYRWFNDYGYEADIPALKEEHPGLVSFEQYLGANGWENAGSPWEG